MKKTKMISPDVLTLGIRLVEASWLRGRVGRGGGGGGVSKGFELKKGQASGNHQ